MCRLYGFSGQHPLPLIDPLLRAPNALISQSRIHCHSWGIGFYQADQVLLERGIGPAHADTGFRDLASRLQPSLVITHLRLATIGGSTLANAHPFQHGKWLFAHNGDIYGFFQLRPYLLEEISAHHRSLIRGETDSEHFFYLFLSRLELLCEPEHAGMADVEEALSISMQKIASWCRLLGFKRTPCMNFLVSNGESFAATRLGRELHYLLEIESDIETSAPPLSTRLPIRYQEGVVAQRLQIASEKISDDPRWTELPNNSVIVMGPTHQVCLRLEVADLTSLESSPMPPSLHGSNIAN